MNPEIFPKGSVQRREAMGESTELDIRGVMQLHFGNLELNPDRSLPNIIEDHDLKQPILNANLKVLQYVKHVMKEKETRSFKFNPYEAFLLLTKLNLEYKKLETNRGTKMNQGRLKGKLEFDFL